MTQVDESRRVEDAAARLNSSLLALSRCNRVLWQAREEQELLQSICQILVEPAGVRLVWIGYCEDDAEKTRMGEPRLWRLDIFPVLHFPWSLMRDRTVFSICVARLPFMPTLSTGVKSNDMRIWHRT